MRLVIAVSSFVILLPVASKAADPKDDPQAIVDRAIQAHGGAAKLAMANAHTWKTKGSMDAGGMKMDYMAEYIFASPDEFRFDVDMAAGGMKIKLSVATDGKIAWEQMGTELREMAKEKHLEFAHTVYVMNLSLLTPLKDKACKLTSLGESKHGDQTLVGIKVSREGRRDVNMYFDKKTGLLTMTSSKVMDEFANKEVLQETLMTGYRDKDGFKIFEKLTIKRDGKDFIVEEMSDEKMLENVDEKKFAKPAGK